MNDGRYEICFSNTDFDSLPTIEMRINSVKVYWESVDYMQKIS